MGSESNFKKDQVVIFDLCGTLYDSNTTFGFLDTYLLPSSRYYRVVRRLTKLLPWRIFNRVLFSFTGIDLTRQLAIRALKKKDKSWLNGTTDTFFHEVLQQKRIEPAHQLLEEARKAGSRIILMSASLDFIVAKAAGILRIDKYYASELKYSDSSCNGVLSNDLLGRKEQLCVKENIPLENAIIVTDNLSDLNLVKKSAHAYIVSTPKDVNFWKGQKNINMIYV